ncbi:uncharacterized protein METZ01_LOCUS464240 [marine metagenome]|uniref:Uncharacterized protein n=1 Tax=marine metagenome TaxID=408172 RepID=A0A383ATX4_9ZZZZ
MAIILIGNHGGGRLRPGGHRSLLIPHRIALKRSENTRRNFASDLKRFREAVGRRRVGRLKPEELSACLFRFLCHDSPPPQMIAIPGRNVVSFTLRADCPRRGRAR